MSSQLIAVHKPSEHRFGPLPISLEDISHAERQIHGLVRHTPLIRHSALSRDVGTNIYLKLEIFQKTGAFKVRGAYNKMLAMTAEDRQRGVLAVSAGNHGQAVAYAARQMRVEATILLPQTTPRVHVDAVKAYGANVIFRTTIHDSYKEMDRLAQDGRIVIHPFDDPLVMAGQGTIGLEIARELPAATDIIVSIGGGGMAAGVAIAVKGSIKGVRIWGVETEGADTMHQALSAGHLVTLPAITSVARSLGAPSVSLSTLSAARSLLDGLIVVSDQEAISALFFILERAKLLAEPAASCTLAAARRLKGRFSQNHHVVLVLCGGNVGVDDLEDYRSKLTGLGE